MNRAVQLFPFTLVSLLALGIGALVTMRVQFGIAMSQTLAEIRPSVPEQSFYGLDVSIRTANGNHVSLPTLAGKPRVATMFYTHCASMCPAALQALQELDASLTERQRLGVGFLLLSLDPDRDSTTVLGEHASRAALDTSRWIIGSTEAAQVDAVASRLGIGYRPLANGEFDHSSEFVLLDAQGRVIARTSAGVSDESFLSVLRAQVPEHAP